MNLVQNFERMWKQLGIATMRNSITPVKIRKDGMVTVVFWKDGRPQCKIKRKDFGLKWPG